MLWWQWAIAAAFPLSVVLIGLVVALWRKPPENDGSPGPSNP